MTRLLSILLTALSALAALTGCGTSAIVTARDGSYEGTITGSDSGRIYVDGRPIEREKVTDIDHPGNVAAIIGSVVAGVGILSALGNCSEEQRAVNDAPCASSGLWMLTGVPIAIYGFVTHSGSVSRASE